MVTLLAERTPDDKDTSPFGQVFVGQVFVGQVFVGQVFVGLPSVGLQSVSFLSGELFSVVYSSCILLLFCLARMTLKPV